MSTPAARAVAAERTGGFWRLRMSDLLDLLPPGYRWPAVRGGGR